MRLLADVVEALLKDKDMDDQEGYCRVKEQVHDECVAFRLSDFQVHVPATSRFRTLASTKAMLGSRKNAISAVVCSLAACVAVSRSGSGQSCWHEP